MKEQFLLNTEKKTLREMATTLGLAKVNKVNRTVLTEFLIGFSYSVLRTSKTAA